MAIEWIGIPDEDTITEWVGINNYQWIPFSTDPPPYTKGTVSSSVSSYNFVSKNVDTDYYFKTKNPPNNYYFISK